MEQIQKGSEKYTRSVTESNFFAQCAACNLGESDQEKNSCHYQRWHAVRHDPLIH